MASRNGLLALLRGRAPFPAATGHFSRHATLKVIRSASIAVHT